MIRFIFLALLVYILYKLVFHFIIPVYKATRQVKKGFRNMQQQMDEQMKQQQQQQGYGAGHEQSSTEKAGDYIDFEEIR